MDGAMHFRWNPLRLIVPRTPLLALATMLLFSLACGSAWAQNNPLITFNEFGTGTLLFPSGQPIPMSCVPTADPGPGGKTTPPLPLFCNLLGPPSLVLGDLIITEPAGGTTDLLRFANLQGLLGFFIYSDNVDGVDALADVGLPTAFNTNTATVTEVGPEGANGITYTPTANQPGFVGGFAATYSFTSDGPPQLTLTKAFADSNIQLFGPNTTSLSFTITNNTAVTQTGIAFSDTLPAGLIVATPNGVNIGTCAGATVTAVAGTNSVALSNLTLAANASCTFSVNVSGTAIGVFVNTTSIITAASGANGVPATATIEVNDLFLYWFFAESGGGGRP